MDRTMNGHRVITHDGSWEGFESVLMMVPECHLGLFLTTNATGGVDAATDVIRTFFDRFVPDTAASGAAPAPAGSATSTEPAPAPASRLAVAAPKAGFYEPARHNESSIEKLLVLLGPLRLTVRGDGTVHFKGKNWAPGANGLYIRADGEDHLVFLAGRDGRRYVATDGPTYQVLSADQAPTVNLPVLLGFILVALGGLAVPAAALWRRVRRRPTGTTTTTWRLGRALAAGATTLGLGFLVLLAVRLFGDTSDFLYGVPGSFRALLVLPVVALVLGGAALACTVAGWRGSRAVVVARVHQAILLAGLAALAWFLWQWNLVG
jgi:hypothetical protein